MGSGIGSTPQGTTRAENPEGFAVYFTDIVYEDEVVDVFPTMKQAELDEGPHRKMRVCRDDDHWYLEPVNG